MRGGLHDDAAFNAAHPDEADVELTDGSSLATNIALVRANAAYGAALAVASIACATPALAQNAGFMLVQQPQVDGPPVEVGVWYPTTATSGPTVPCSSTRRSAMPDSSTSMPAAG